MNDKIGNSSGSNSCISPFGVKLKCTPGGGCAGAEKEKEKQKRDTVIVIHKRLQEDEAAEKKLSHQRCNLRKVPGPSPSIVRRQRHMERKPSVKTYIHPGGVNEPFMLLHDKAPVFGVVLRSTNRAESKEEEQEHLDLDFGGSRSSPTSDAKEKEGPLFPFGVRLKPTRQQHNHHPTGIFNRAYQIDLSPPPPSKCNNNTYLNEHPRSVLEIKLRPVEKSGASGNSNNDHDDQQLVELQLRHVVAPEDGGPKHVTQALLLVPLKKVPSLLNRGSSASHLQDLLQLTIHSPRGRHDSHVPEFLQIRLRHVDPATRQTHDASQVIDLKLNHVIPQKANIDTHPLSMQVTLRHVERVSRPIQAWVPEFANIQLKSVARCQEKPVDEEEETEYDEHDDEDEDVVVEKEAIVEECATEQQAAVSEAKEADKQDAVKEEAEEKRKVKFGDAHHHQTAATKAAEAEAESNKNARQAAKEEKERQRRQAEEDEQRAREERERLAEEKIRRDEAESRRLQHEIDTLKREAEEWARNKKLQEEARLELERQAAEQAELDLQKKREERHEKIKLRRQLSVHEKKAILERREGAYLYWQKLNRPTRQHFKETIHLLGNTGITNQDIDTLPWMMHDTFVDIRLMNEAAVKGDAFWGTIVEKLFESESENASS